MRSTCLDARYTTESDNMTFLIRLTLWNQSAVIEYTTADKDHANSWLRLIAEQTNSSLKSVTVSVTAV